MPTSACKYIVLDNEQIESEEESFSVNDEKLVADL